MYRRKNMLMFILSTLFSVTSLATGIEWYEPIFEGIDPQGRARITVSGETDTNAKVSIDLSKVIVIRGPQRGKKLAPESATTTSDEKGTFELKTRLPRGLLQVPIVVKGFETQSILVLFDISDTGAKLNVKTKARPPKQIPKAPTPPPTQLPVVAKSEEKPLRSERPERTERVERSERTESRSFAFDYSARLMVGGNYQKVNQKQEGTNELAFQNIQFPSMGGTFNFDGRTFSGELGFQTHPSAITQAEAPFSLIKSKANWQILNADVFWKMGNRLSKMGSRVRLGVQSHKIPFLSINTSNQVSLLENSMLGLALGYSWRFGDPQGWSYDAMLSYIYPISYDSSELKSFSLLPKLGAELSLGVTKKISDRLFWGGHWVVAIQNHGFTYKDSTLTTTFNGELNLMLSIFTVDIGINF